MAIFLGIHEFGEPLTKERMEDNWNRYKASADKHGVHAWRVYYNLEQGRSWCITEADSADAVNAAHDDEDLPTKELIEVQKFKK